MPTKKTIKKKPNPQAAKTVKQTTDSGGHSTILKWFFIPDIKQGWGKWLLRAGLFTIGLLVFAAAFSVLVMQISLLESGAEVPSFLTILKMIVLLSLEAPLKTALLIFIIFAFGMFAFMPRKHLDKTSFVATLWTFMAWTIIVGIITYILNQNEVKFALDFLALPLAALIIFFLAGVLASIVCYARKIGASPLSILLSVPFGLSFYEYAGYFLPDSGKDKVIVIKYRWYERFLKFMLDTIQGQGLLVIAMLLLLLIQPYPWEVIIIILFGGLYFWRKKEWMIENIKCLSWIVAAINIAICSGVIYFSQSIDSSLFAIGLM
ncbi:MAG: hypothetical protein LBD94_03595 [Rickettsiales bacterium]|jgi:hypothetical protein|nr:hypothetical protein [Rickettsiales bacterium]